MKNQGVQRNADGLTDKEQIFVRLYPAVYDSPMLAYIACGYMIPVKRLEESVDQLMNRPIVKRFVEEKLKLLKERQKAEGDIADVDDMQRLWTQIARDPEATNAARMKASEMLARSKGAFSGKGDQQSDKLEDRLSKAEERIADAKADTTV